MTDNTVILHVIVPETTKCLKLKFEHQFDRGMSMNFYINFKMNCIDSFRYHS